MSVKDRTISDGHKFTGKEQKIRLNIRLRDVEQSHGEKNEGLEWMRRRGYGDYISEDV